jgi:predicted phage terminase large subunit-like protein
MIIRPTIHEVDALYRVDFPSFVGKCVHSLNPGSPFLMNWHIEAIAYYLQQVRLGRIRRLIINMAPRALKSVMSSVAFPAFVLGHDPSKRLIAVSYAAEVAVKHSNDFRAILNSSWYQRVFPRTRVSRLKNTEFELVTTLNGYRLATSIDGSLTGRGGDIIVIDDPLKPTDALSDSKRERTNDWFYNTLLSRLDNKLEGAIILVMQRLHVDDLTGILLRASSEWVLLSFPAIAERDETIQIGANRYHTRRVGDVLHAEREPRWLLESYRSRHFAAQYQQQPVPPGGAMIKPDWIPRYDQLPPRDSPTLTLRSWDTASKEGGENDFSACITLLIQGSKYYIADVTRGRFNYPTLKSRAIWHARHHQADKILIEDAGVGTALITELQNAGLSAIAVKPEHDKVTRMSIQSGKFESGQVYFPRQAQWLADFENEIFAFPNVSHDDQVDALSQALAHHQTGYCWDKRSLRNLERFTAAICGW